MPLVLTITIMALSEVDGNSILGICFVGYRNHMIRGTLAWGPVLVMLCISALFILRGMFQLVHIKKDAIKESSKASNKLHAVILHMGIRATLSILFIFGSFVFQTYEFRNAHIWTNSLNDLIM